MVYAKVLRSMHTHARLLRVDASKAEKLPGVVAILTRDDLGGTNSVFGSVVKDQPVVAMDRVRYVGDVIAAVAAEESDIAEEALDLIEVEYEPLPAVFDPAEAMKPYAPIIHAERIKAQSFPSKSGFRLEAAGNILSIYHVEEGDVGVGFGESDEIFEDMYSSPKIQHAHIEPHAAVAYWEPSGKLVIYTSTQNPSRSERSWQNCSICHNPKCASSCRMSAAATARRRICALNHSQRLWRAKRIDRFSGY